LCFEKFYDSSRSLTAVSRKPPNNRRLSPNGLLGNFEIQSPIEAVMSKKKGILISNMIYSKRKVICRKRIENAQAFSKINNFYVNERNTVS
jgi:hypothetical protein